MFSGLIMAAVDIGKSWFDDYKSERENKRLIKEAVAINKIKMAQSEQTHNQLWELAQLEGKDNLLRRFSFFLLSMPFVIAIFEPEKVKVYFDTAISAVPEWYQYAYIAILGAVWGISEFKKWKS